jgi:hypothetical protein
MIPRAYNTDRILNSAAGYRFSSNERKSITCRNSGWLDVSFFCLYDRSIYHNRCLLQIENINRTNVRCRFCTLSLRLNNDEDAHPFWWFEFWKTSLKKNLEQDWECARRALQLRGKITDSTWLQPTFEDLCNSFGNVGHHHAQKGRSASVTPPVELVKVLTILEYALVNTFCKSFLWLSSLISNSNTWRVIPYYFLERDTLTATSSPLSKGYPILRPSAAGGTIK